MRVKFANFSVSSRVCPPGAARLYLPGKSGPGCLDRFRDLAKQVIQIHAVDANSKVVTNRPSPRDKLMIWYGQLPPGCLSAMEASSGSLSALLLGGFKSKWNTWFIE